MILGLTGSIGSGKSFVSDLLEQCGAVVIRADAIAHEVVAPGSPALSEIASQFGTDLIREDGSLDRQRLAAVVFADPDKRKALERIIHPRVRERELELIAENRDQALIVLEIPLLFETQAEKLCDAVAVVTVSDEERLSRLQRDRGMSESEVRVRLAAQMPQEEKVRRADFVIDNSGSRADTEEAVTALFRKLEGTRKQHTQ